MMGLKDPKRSSFMYNTGLSKAELSDCLGLQGISHGSSTKFWVVCLFVWLGLAWFGVVWFVLVCFCFLTIRSLRQKKKR